MTLMAPRLMMVASNIRTGPLHDTLVTESGTGRTIAFWYRYRLSSIVRGTVTDMLTEATVTTEAVEVQCG